jgi:hypothetical protein
MPRRLGPLPGAILLAIVAALVLAAPAAAASPWFSFSQSGTSAMADTSDCTENIDGTLTCAGESLFVFEGTMKASGERSTKGEHVCYGQFTETFDPETGEVIDSQSVSGCTLDAGTLTVNDLDSIVLAPTVIELMTIECDEFECTETPAGSTTVSGTWTGTGPVVSQKGRFTWDDSVCVQVQADRGSFREATFEGTFDAQHAQMRTGRSTFRTTCTF